MDRKHDCRFNIANRKTIVVAALVGLIVGGWDAGNGTTTRYIDRHFGMEGLVILLLVNVMVIIYLRRKGLCFKKKV